MATSFEVSNPDSREATLLAAANANRLELGGAREVRAGGCTARRCGCFCGCAIITLLVLCGVLFGSPYDCYCFFFGCEDPDPDPFWRDTTTTITTTTTTTTTTSTTTTTTTTIPPDCSELPASVTGTVSDVGCAGAKNDAGGFSEAICTNSGGQMDSTSRWYAACCTWKDDKCNADLPCLGPPLESYDPKTLEHGTCKEGASISNQGLCTPSSCKEGFTPFPPFLKCKDGELQPMQFQCQKSCSAPTGIANAASDGACAEGKTVLSQDSCTAKCAPGYRPVGTKDATIKNPDFLFNGNQLVCCHPGFWPPGSTIGCKGDTFYPPTFECKPTSCTVRLSNVTTGIASMRPSGTYRDGARIGIANLETDDACVEGATLQTGESCTIQCASGYTPSVPTLTCSDGTISPASFKCKPPAPKPPSQCTSDDLTKIKALKQDTSSGSFGSDCGVCGTAAYHVMSGFSKKGFNDCLTAKLQISEACSDCYAEAGYYGASNCKMACLSGWCTEHCLQCTKNAQEKSHACSGFSPPDLTPC